MEVMEAGVAEVAAAGAELMEAARRASTVMVCVRGADRLFWTDMSVIQACVWLRAMRAAEEKGRKYALHVPEEVVRAAEVTERFFERHSPEELDVFWGECDEVVAALLVLDGFSKAFLAEVRGNAGV